MQENITTKKKPSLKNLVIGITIIGLTALGINIYYQYTLKYPSTDDAYVNANLINVAPKVGGFIKNIHVTKNQYVKTGDVLFEIDPLDYNLETNHSEQNVIYSEQQAKSMKQNIDIAKVNVTKAQTNYDFYKKLAIRYTNLYKEKAGTLQDMQQYQNQLAQAKEQLDSAKLGYEQAKTQYETYLSQIKLNKIMLETAKTNKSYTIVTSSVNGYVTNLNLADGQLVQPGQNLFGIIDDSSWWIDANFKETQLARLRVGQKVKITLDMYKEHEFTGTIEGISRGSGNTFSIIPAQNATGNWVKITQRFPVTIKIEDDPKYPLRVGASAEVTVDTTSLLGTK